MAMNLALKSLGINESKLKVGTDEFKFDGNTIIDKKGNKILIYKGKVVLGKTNVDWNLIQLLYSIGKNKGIIKWNNY